jgi:diketogulonate reductase-like aldo/keto reductase
MEEAFALSGSDEIATNQALDDLVHRGIEWDLLPWCRQRGLPVVAYSPIEHSPREQKRMLNHLTLEEIAAQHSATPYQNVVFGCLIIGHGYAGHRRAA